MAELWDITPTCDCMKTIKEAFCGKKGCLGGEAFRLAKENNKLQAENTELENKVVGTRKILEKIYIRVTLGHGVSPCICRGDKSKTKCSLMVALGLLDILLNKGDKQCTLKF